MSIMIPQHAPFCSTLHELEPVDGSEAYPCTSPEVVAGQATVWATATDEVPVITMIGAHALSVAEFARFCREGLSLANRLERVPAQRSGKGVASVNSPDAGFVDPLPILAALSLLFAVLGGLALIHGGGWFALALMALAPFLVIVAVVLGSGKARSRPARQKVATVESEVAVEQLADAGNTTVGLVVAAFLVAAPIPFMIDAISAAVRR